VYDLSVKKCPPRVRTSSPVSGSPKNLRVLKKCIRELQAILVEASTILDHLVLHPAAEIIRSLCARFCILQEYFAMRYQEARACAIAALGHVEAALSFP
jgi:hypothetical protein